MRSSNIIGKNGEELVREYLESEGYIIIAQNFSYRRQGVRGQLGEIDIVALKNNILHIVEVKSQNSLGFGSAIERVTPQKIQFLRSAYEAFVMKNNHYRKYFAQIDVALVVQNKVEMLWNVG
jgi:putative endonuclease